MCTKTCIRLGILAMSLVVLLVCPLSMAGQGVGVPGYRYWLDSDSTDYFMIRAMQERQNQPSFRNEEILTPVGGTVWSYATDVVLVDSFAIVQNYTGLEIFNIQNVTNIVLRKRVVFDGGAGYEEMRVAGRFLYLPRSHRLLVLDISDPLEPVLVRTIRLSGIIMSLRIDNDHLIAGLLRSDGDFEPYPAFHIYSLADSANPIAIGKYESPLLYKDARSMAFAGQYVYTTNYWSHRVEIVNIVDPSHPVKAGDVSTPYPSLIERFGDYLYVYCDDRQIRTFSIVDPENPTQIDSLPVIKICSIVRDDSIFVMGATDTEDPQDTAYVYAFRIGSDGLLDEVSVANGLRGFVRGMALRDSILFAPDVYHSMSAFNVRNPASMQLVSQISNKANDLFGIAIQDQYAYVSSKRGRFCVVDIADTVHPVEMGVYLTPRGNPEEIVAADELLFWQNCWTSRIYSLADPANPVYLTLFPPTPPDFSTHSAIRHGNRLYQASAVGLIISDITNPSTPIELARGVPPYRVWALDLYRIGDIIYYPGVLTADGLMDTYKFLTIDISNETQPTIIDSITFKIPEGDPPFGAVESHMERYNNYLYGAFGGYGLWVIDISTPARPDVVKRFYKPLGLSADVECKRNYLFHAASYQMDIYDITVPSAPELIQIMPMSSYCERIEFVGDYLYAVQRTGVVIYKLNLPPVDCGDADASGLVNISDAVFLIAYIFAGGTPPDPLAAGDVDCSGMTNISDVVYLINYIFTGGPAPCAAC